MEQSRGSVQAINTAGEGTENPEGIEEVWETLGSGTDADDDKWGVIALSSLQLVLDVKD